MNMPGISPAGTLANPMARLGIDIGGTFVDLVLAGSDGVLEFEKVLAEPADLLGSIARGVRTLLARADVPGADISEVLHATTRGSNIVLERAGPKTALVVTKGFRDVLQIQRALRWSMYDVQLEKPEPLVPRSLAFEVSERVLPGGSVHVPLDEDQLRDVAAEIRAAKVQALAVTFLHSYANPAHERAAVALLRRELPDTIITPSSDVSLQAREYERANTAVVNAYVAEAIADYMELLGTSLAEVGVSAPIWVMQSSGGLASVSEAVERPVRVLESGPAAGVIGAAAFGKAAGSEDVISFDMGGTTAKVAVVSAGVPAMTTYFELQRVGTRRGSGLPVDIPALDLVEVGTGGGSIAEVREGTLRVGPRSAGADPGPACYGRNGKAPTVTDANLVLGYYDPNVFAGGLTLDLHAAEAAITRLADQLHLRADRRRLGHPRGGDRRHGARDPARVDQPRVRSAPARAGLHRRCRAGARPAPGPRARLQPGDHPARRERRLGAGPARGGGVERGDADGHGPPRRRGVGRGLLAHHRRGARGGATELVGGRGRQRRPADPRDALPGPGLRAARAGPARPARARCTRRAFPRALRECVRLPRRGPAGRGGHLARVAAPARPTQRHAGRQEPRIGTHETAAPPGLLPRDRDDRSRRPRSRRAARGRAN